MKIKTCIGYEISFFDGDEPVRTPVYEYVDVDRSEMMKGIKRGKMAELKEARHSIERNMFKDKDTNWLFEYWKSERESILSQMKKFCPKRRETKGTSYVDASDVRDKYTAGELLTRYGIHSKNGFIRCISPDHSDNTPSTIVYDYNVHCFGCQKTLDTIAIVMALEPCDFKTALEHLNK